MIATGPIKALVHCQGMSCTGEFLVEHLSVVLIVNGLSISWSSYVKLALLTRGCSREDLELEQLKYVHALSTGKKCRQGCFF